MFVGALVLGITSLVGCSSGGQHPDVTVEPSSSRFDVPVHIVVRGLRPDSTVTLTLRSTDTRGTAWSSAASFRSNTAGTADLATDPAVSGSYQGVDPMGLVETMQTVPPEPDAFQWSNGSVTFVLSVAARGRTVATKSFSRVGNTPGVTVRQETIAATGQRWTIRPP
jgi:Acyl-CoA thioester hydrolase/BAAT N-terminal region.